MVRKKRERTRATFTPESMEAAVAEVRDNGTSLRQAAEMYNVKFTTLRRYVLKKQEDPNARMEPNYSVRAVFSKVQEESLCKYIKKCSEMAYGLNTTKVRKLAYEMAHRNRIKCPESWKTNKRASADWLRAFIKRATCLSIRKPEACSLSRLTSFNRHNVNKFFSNLEEVYRKYPVAVEEIRIYNLDETATTTVQQPQKVLAQKGIKQLNQCSSAERGTLATTVAIIRADGTFLPPVIVFPRKKFKQIMLNGAPPNTLGLANPSGWMTAELFQEVLMHFIKHSNTSLERPSILVYDNHESHVSLEIAETARLNGVIIVTLPPHCSNKLQPLDKAVFSPFKTFYNAAIDSWLVNHPGVPMTLYQIAECVGIAHSKAMNPENILSSFRTTGIYPFNSNIFSEVDFMSSSVTDRPQEIGNGDTEATERANLILITDDDNALDNNNSANPPEDGNALDNINNPDPPDIIEEPAGPSGIQNSSKISGFQESDPNLERTTTDSMNSTPPNHSDDISSTKTSDPFISPIKFAGLPKAQPRKNIRKGRQSRGSIILTSTPELKELSYKTESKKAPKVKISKAVKKNISELNDTKQKRQKRKQKNEKHISDTDSDSVEIELQDSSDDERYLINLQYFDPEKERNDDAILNNEIDITKLQNDSFVLIRFPENIHYVAKIVENSEHADELKVSYLRKSTKIFDSFHFPNVPDISMALKSDIVMVLPEPICAANKRLSAYYKFGINFQNMVVR